MKNTSTAIIDKTVKPIHLHDYRLENTKVLEFSEHTVSNETVPSHAALSSEVIDTKKLYEKTRDRAKCAGDTNTMRKGKKLAPLLNGYSSWTRRIDSTSSSLDNCHVNFQSTAIITSLIIVNFKKALLKLLFSITIYSELDIILYLKSL